MAVLISAYDYRGGSGVFPRFIGWVFLGLTFTECLIQLKAFFSSPISTTTNTDRILTEKAKVKKEIMGVLWIVVFLVLLYMTGFLVGIPLYTFTFLRFSAKRSYKQCIVISVGATMLFYLLFVELLQYRLFQGVFFGA